MNKIKISKSQKECPECAVDNFMEALQLPFETPNPKCEKPQDLKPSLFQSRAASGLLILELNFSASEVSTCSCGHTVCIRPKRDQSESDLLAEQILETDHSRIGIHK